MTTPAQNIHLHYVALLREQRGVDHESVMTTAQTPRDLYQELRIAYNFTLPPDQISVAVNEEFCPPDYHLRDGDRVVFLPPVAGG